MSAPIYLNDLGVVCALGAGRAGDRAAHGSRDFVIADSEPAVPEGATSGPKSAIDAAAPWREAPGKEE